MTMVAAIPHAPAVNVLGAVTSNALAVDIPGLATVAGVARYRTMASRQGEIGVGIVVERRLVPVIGVVAALTRLAILTEMHVIGPMAAIAGGGRFIRHSALVVAAFTVELAMTAP